MESGVSVPNELLLLLICYEQHHLSALFNVTFDNASLSVMHDLHGCADVNSVFLFMQTFDAIFFMFKEILTFFFSFLPIL